MRMRVFEDVCVFEGVCEGMCLRGYEDVWFAWMRVCSVRACVCVVGVVP